jgi:hypothetical protein
MPSTNVSIELKMAWHSSPDKRWAANDVYDIDAMSLAVPYCDVVVTAKACRNTIDLGNYRIQRRVTRLAPPLHAENKRPKAIR